MARYLDNSEDYPRTERSDERPVRLSATEARQGYLGRPVLMVLIGGILLAMIAWAGAEYFGAHIAPETEQTQDAVQQQVTPPADTGNAVREDDPVTTNPPVTVEP